MNDTMITRSFFQAQSDRQIGDNNLSPVKLARRQKLLDAAERLFSAHGFRGASIEAIADAAAMSKVTVYGYFKDKDAVFAGVAKALAARLMAAVDAALHRDIAIDQRISEALIAKHFIIFDLVRTSPFSKELFQAKDRHVEKLFLELGSMIIAALGESLMEHDLPTDFANQTARRLFAASDGIAEHALDKAQMADDITILVKALLNQWLHEIGRIS